MFSISHLFYIYFNFFYSLFISSFVLQILSFFTYCLFQVPDREKCQIPQNRYLTLDLPRFAQQLRQQQPSLPVHLDLLPVIVGPVEKLFLRRIEIGEPCQLLLDPFPLLEGIHLSNLPIQTCDVELLPVLLVDHPLELGRDLEPSFFVDPGWMIAAKHGVRLSEAMPKPRKIRLKSFDSGCSSCFWVGFPPAPRFQLARPTDLMTLTTLFHFLPHLSRKSFIVKQKLGCI